MILLNPAHQGGLGLPAVLLGRSPSVWSAGFGNCGTLKSGITPFGWGPEDQEGRCAMSAQSDQAKGHAKEAAGLLTGDEELQAEGKAERVAGEAAERTDKVKDTVEGGLDKVQHTLNDALNRAKKAVRRS